MARHSKDSTHRVHRDILCLWGAAMYNAWSLMLLVFGLVLFAWGLPGLPGPDANSWIGRALQVANSYRYGLAFILCLVSAYVAMVKVISKEREERDKALLNRPGPSEETRQVLGRTMRQDITDPATLRAHAESLMEGIRSLRDSVVSSVTADHDQKTVAIHPRARVNITPEIIAVYVKKRNDLLWLGYRVTGWPSDE